MCSQCFTTVLLRIGVLKDFAKANGNIARVSRALVCPVFRVTWSSSVSVLIEYCETKRLLFFHHLLEIRKAYLPCSEDFFIQNTEFCDDVEGASIYTLREAILCGCVHTSWPCQHQTLSLQTDTLKPYDFLLHLLLIVASVGCTAAKLASLHKSI